MRGVDGLSRRGIDYAAVLGIDKAIGRVRKNLGCTGKELQEKTAAMMETDRFKTEFDKSVSTDHPGLRDVMSHGFALALVNDAHDREAHYYRTATTNRLEPDDAHHDQQGGYETDADDLDDSDFDDIT